jgi:hypothetical protein
VVVNFFALFALLCRHAPALLLEVFWSAVHKTNRDQEPGGHIDVSAPFLVERVVGAVPAGFERPPHRKLSSERAVVPLLQSFKEVGLNKAALEGRKESFETPLSAFFLLGHVRIHFRMNYQLAVLVGGWIPVRVVWRNHAFDVRDHLASIRVIDSSPDANDVRRKRR